MTLFQFLSYHLTKTVEQQYPLLNVSYCFQKGRNRHCYRYTLFAQKEPLKWVKRIFLPHRKRYMSHFHFYLYLLDEQYSLFPELEDNLEKLFTHQAPKKESKKYHQQKAVEFFNSLTNQDIYDFNFYPQLKKKIETIYEYAFLNYFIDSIKSEKLIDESSVYLQPYIDLSLNSYVERNMIKNRFQYLYNFFFKGELNQPDILDFFNVKQVWNRTQTDIPEWFPQDIIICLEQRGYNTLEEFLKQVKNTVYSSRSVHIRAYFTTESVFWLLDDFDIESIIFFEEIMFFYQGEFAVKRKSTFENRLQTYRVWLNVFSQSQYKERLMNETDFYLYEDFI